MFAQFTSAFARAVLMILLVITPAITLPNISADAQQFAFLGALFAGGFVFIEYYSTYPSILEFRFAKPFNRIRFFSVFVTVFILSAALSASNAPHVLNGLLLAIGNLIGEFADIPYSPVRLLLLTIPADAGAATLEALRLAASVAYVMSLLSLGLFYFLVQVMNWPSANGAFNVWVNLPLFDPTAGGDVLKRLIRDGRVNVILGLLLPFIFPALVSLTAGNLGPAFWQDPQTLIWSMVFWAFFPATMVMRGIAMMRIATMIDQDRRRAYAQAQDLQPI